LREVSPRHVDSPVIVNPSRAAAASSQTLMLFVGTYSPISVNLPSVETQNGSGFDPDADENEGAR
jgi:hypothetical protein